MIRAVLFFALGILVFFQVPQIPAWRTGFLLVAALVPLIAWRRGRWLALLPVGFLWAQLMALATQPAALPIESGPRVLPLSGQVVSLIQRRGPIARFVMRVDRYALDGDETVGDWPVRLSWRAPPQLRPGDRLHATVRVKPVHGYASPGAWDYEGWLYRQGIRYTGYVVAGEVDPTRHGACCVITGLRQQISEQLDGLPLSAFSRGVLRALVVGDRSGMTVPVRNLFRDTGTSHLMAISGLHIGLVAGLGLLSFGAVWRHLPSLCARVPTSVAAAVFGLVLASIYALLAGFSLPTQRALIMLGVVTLALWWRRDPRPGGTLAVAAAAVLLWDPPSIVEAGFWLSFGAVAAILAGLSLAPKESRWRTAVRIQLIISIALWPLLSLFGLPAAIIAPLVNLVLVPLFGLLIVPTAFLATLLLPIATVAGEWLFGNLAWLLDLVHIGLDAAAALAAPLQLIRMQGTLAGLVGLLGVALLLSPRAFPLRWMALPLLVAVSLPRAPTLHSGEYNVHVLDVGQGLAVVVETSRHTLVFDTGPSFPSGFSTADAVVLPFLNERGRSRIDRLVLSHGDNDHAGGAQALHRGIAIDTVHSGEPARLDVAAYPCRYGQMWFWDGVRFEFLHPRAGERRHGNDASCVLRIANRRAVTLLTGDIEKAAEQALLRTVRERLRSQLVIAPHHGSGSSSGMDFVAATQPRYLVFSAGWANRYGFPHETVRQRWRAAGAQLANTASAGSLSFRVDERGGVAPPRCQRVHERRFWWHDGGSAGACHAVSSPD